jgi:hypothetical protein
MARLKKIILDRFEYARLKEATNRLGARSDKTEKARYLEEKPAAMMGVCRLDNRQDYYPFLTYQQKENMS